jgi:hypothetical protein
MNGEKKKTMRSKLYTKILVTLILALMIFGLGTIETKAAYLDLSTFNKNAGMFCLNQGREFGTGNYDKGINFEIKNGEIVKDEYFGPTGKEEQYREFIEQDVGFIKQHAHVAAYILSELPEDGVREVHYRQDPNQLAMWLFGGATNLTEANVDQFRAAVKVAANAKAYEEFILQSYNVGATPQVTGSPDVVSGKKVNGKDLVGPFNITYPYAEVSQEFTAKVRREEKVSHTETGIYGELISMTFGGNQSINAGEIYNASGNLITDLWGGYPKSGQDFYIAVNIVEGSELTLSVESNNAYRDAEYSIQSTDKATVDPEKLEDYQNILAGKGTSGVSRGDGAFEPKSGFKMNSQEPEITVDAVMEGDGDGKAILDGETGVDIIEAKGRANIYWDMGWEAAPYEEEVTKDLPEVGGVERRTISYSFSDHHGTPSYTVSWTRWGWQEGTATIWENQAPTGYKKIEGKIRINIKRYVIAKGTENVPANGSTHHCECNGCGYVGNEEDGYTWQHYYNKTCYQYNWNADVTSDKIDWEDWKLDVEHGTIHEVTKITDTDDSVLKEEFDQYKTPSSVVEIIDEKLDAMTKIRLKIYDIPVVTFGGNVWLDQADDESKLNNPADGKMGAGEPMIEGVRVKLYKGAPGAAIKNSKGSNVYGERDPQGGGVQVVTDLYGNSLRDIKTDSSGRYDFSLGDHQAWGIERAADYYIKFEYDGVNYDATTKGRLALGEESTKLSHASEEKYDRPGFNSKFETISGGNSAQDGTSSTGEAGVIPLTYDENNKNNRDGIYTSTLITTEPKGNSLKTPRIMSEFEGQFSEFKMNAKTDSIILGEHMEEWWRLWVGEEEYSKCYMNINMGLCERVLELSIKTDIDRADIEINDKKTTYIYDQIKATGGLLINMEDAENSYDHKKYNLNLYRSDYYYRIKDYVTGENRIDNPVYDGYIDQDNVTTDQEIDAIPEEEMLDVYVTYKMLITNHTNHPNVIINEVVDYYDINYEYISGELRAADGITVLDGEIDAITRPETRNIEQKPYKQLEITNINNGQPLGANGSRWIFVTFKVTPNPNDDSGGYQPIHLQAGESHPDEVRIY